jgi:hypothetical protein
MDESTLFFCQKALSFFAKKRVSNYTNSPAVALARVDHRLDLQRRQRAHCSGTSCKMKAANFETRVLLDGLKR